MMITKAERLSASFVISTGDNFYLFGVKDLSDGQFYRTFETMFSAPALQIPWFVALGNHDYTAQGKHGNATAEVPFCVCLFQFCSCKHLYVPISVCLPIFPFFPGKK